MKFLTKKDPSRPAPVGKLPSLVSCIILDLIGFATYSIPFFGEFLDLFWAPLSAMIFFLMFGGWKGAIGGVFSFLEEFLPGTDFIPTFSIMWLLRRWQIRSAEKNAQTLKTV